MALTQVGPNRFVDLSCPEFRHLKPWTPPVGQKAPTRNAWRARAAAPAAPAPRAAVIAPSTSKRLLSAPVLSPEHPTCLSREEIATEFDALYEWMKAADAASGTFSPQQLEQRDAIGARVDLLRAYRWA